MYRAKQRGRRSVEYQTGARDAERDEPRSRASPACTARSSATSWSCTTSRSSTSHSRQPIALEALVRWNHPELGLVPPGRLHPAGRGHRAHRAAGLARARARAAPAAAPARPQRSRSTCRRASSRSPTSCRASPSWSPSVPRGSLTLEITESLLIDEPDRIATHARGARRGRRAHRARRLRNRLLEPLDTSARCRSTSSRSTAASSPASANAPSREALVSGIINLGHGLELEVVAEGVETAQQAQRLERLDCDFAQGFLFGRPVPWTTRTSRTDSRTSRRHSSSPRRCSCARR